MGIQHEEGQPGPVAQEKRKGHNLYDMGSETYGEVSKFKGKVYVSIRRWFKADDGRWYRTKNGLNMPITEFHNVILKMQGLHDFMLEEERDPWEDE